MTKIETILTHPGSCHKDEFLACSLLLGVRPVSIVRREPTESDLADPSIAVLDVGLSYNPELHNFDHHQLPKDHPPTCSLSLVLQHLGLYEDALMFCDWLKPAEWFDCRGPIETAKWLGVQRELLNQLSSPIDISLLRRFSLTVKLGPGDALWEVMRMIGEDLLNYLRTLRPRLDFIGQNSTIWRLDLAGTPGQILFLPRTERLPDEPSMGLDQYIDSQGLADQIVGVVYPDRRNTGYGLARFRDNPRLDFTLIGNAEDVHFAHARGFMAKTSATEIGRLQELVMSSAV